MPILEQLYTNRLGFLHSFGELNSQIAQYIANKNVDRSTLSQLLKQKNELMNSIKHNEDQIQYHLFKKYRFGKKSRKQIYMKTLVKDINELNLSEDQRKMIFNSDLFKSIYCPRGNSGNGPSNLILFFAACIGGIATA